MRAQNKGGGNAGDEYLGVAVPHTLNSSSSANCAETGTILKAIVEKGNKGVYAPWMLPAGQLKVGTLDNLVGLSDDLGKFDATLRNCCVQIQKIYSDYGGDEEGLTVNQSHPGNYLCRFKWNVKYNTGKALKELIQEMTTESRTNLGNLMRIKAACVDCNRKLAALSKKTEGNLTVRDFAHKLSKEDVFQTEVFDTVFVVVNKSRVEQFLNTYANPESSKEGKRLLEALKKADDLAKKKAEEAAAEAGDADDDEKGMDKKRLEKAKRTGRSDRLECARAVKRITATCGLVIPMSAKKVDEDKEYEMYRVICLKQAKKAVSVIYREQRHSIRDLEEGWDRPDNDLNESNVQKAKVDKDLKRHQKRLFAVSKHFYSTSFEQWAHLKAIRLFVEAVLRYGLPVRYTFAIVKVNRGSLKTIHTRLSKQFAQLRSSAMDQDEKKSNKNQIDFTGMSDSYRPYVFTEISLP